MRIPDEETLQKIKELAQEAEQKFRVMNESAIAFEVKCQALAAQYSATSSPLTVGPTHRANVEGED